MSKTKSCRHWCVTWHLNQINPDLVKIKGIGAYQTAFDKDEIPTPVYDSEWMRYLVAQGELTKSHGFHWQMYVEFHKTVGLKRVKTHFPGAHCEPRRGTREKARDYCTDKKPADKIDTIVIKSFEDGIWVAGGGDRSDLLVAAVLAKKGEWKSIESETFIRFHRGLREYAALHTDVPRRRQMNVVVWWGPSGSGKSYAAFAQAEESKKPFAVLDFQGGWGDPYASETIALFDEFDGSKLEANVFLRLLDIYPTSVNCKGVAARPWLAETILITSRLHPRDWYPSRSAEVLRRIKTINHLRTPYGPPPAHAITPEPVAPPAGPVVDRPGEPPIPIGNSDFDFDVLFGLVSDNPSPATGRVDNIAAATPRS